MKRRTVKDISLYRATSKCVEEICNGLHNALKRLCIHESKMTEENMAMLSNSLSSNSISLEQLHLDTFDDFVVPVLSAGLHTNTSLLILDLRHWKGITDTSVQELSTMLIKNKALKGLELSYTAVLSLSTALHTNTSLQSLHMWSTELSSIAVQYISIMLKFNTTLQVLDLGGCSITDTEVLYLSSALKHNNSLKVLDLFHNKLITSSGAVALSEMLQVNTKIEELDLKDTSVLEDGASALLNALTKNDTMNTLVLDKHLKQYCISEKYYHLVEYRIRFW